MAHTTSDDVTVITATIRVRDIKVDPNDLRKWVEKVLNENLSLTADDTVTVHVRRWGNASS